MCHLLGDLVAILDPNQLELVLLNAKALLQEIDLHLLQQEKKKQEKKSDHRGISTEEHVIWESIRGRGFISPLDDQSSRGESSRNGFRSEPNTDKECG